MKDTGTLYGTGGDDHWRVTHRIYTDGTGSVTGTIEFPPETRLEPANPALPVYLQLRDGRWLALHIVLASAVQTTYNVGAGSRLSDPPPWLMTAIREGYGVPVRCMDCGGELRADKEFVARRGQSMTNPDESEPFWSTTCAGCGARFNYATRTGRLMRI